MISVQARSVSSSLWLAWFRVDNFRMDTLDRVVKGRCVAKPSGLPCSPVYHFWRCDLPRGHKGSHRSTNYVWSESERGVGMSSYLPAVGARPQNRHPVLTRRQRKARLAWHRARERKVASGGTLS